MDSNFTLTASPSHTDIARPALVDPFGRAHDYLRISITDKCNLRCTYCMPHEKMKFTPSAKLMNPQEIYTIAKTFVDLGVKKIRLTGGEPLVRKDAREILDLLGTLPVQLTMTSNASYVADFIDQFKAIGLNSINISLDTFDEEKFFNITRRHGLKEVLDNIHLLLANDFHVKVNVVVMHDLNDNELCDFVAFTRDYPVHVRFIEFMPFPGNEWKRDKVVTYQEMLDTISQQFTIEKLTDEKHATAKGFRVPGHKGTFGIISTVTKPFCGDCNRLRLTADGKMKNCLFSRGEIDLLSSFRKGEDIYPLIMSSLADKKAALGGQQMYETTENRSMIAIGG